MAENRTLKQRIHRGEPITIASASLRASEDQLKDLLSRETYDLVGVDSQHAPLNEERLVEFCRMAGELDMPVQLRIKHTQHAHLIGNYLDLGPLAIVVPQVEAEATVDEAIDAFYYPPKGKRSWGPGTAYGFSPGMDRLEYAQWWNDTGILILQIESLDAVINARQFAKPGVDMLVFGAQDLSFSLESYRNPPLSTVDECIQYVAQQLEDMPIKVGRSHSPAGRQ